MKLEFPRQIFEKSSNIKVNENPFSGNGELLNYLPENVLVYMRKWSIYVTQEGHLLPKCLYIYLLLNSQLSVSTAPLTAHVKFLLRIRLLGISLFAFQLQAAASYTECPRLDSWSRHMLSWSITWFSTLSSIKHVKMAFIPYSGITGLVCVRGEYWQGPPLTEIKKNHVYLISLYSAQ